MADKKISALTALAAAADDDELAIVDTDASETKKITFSNLTSPFFSDASGAALTTSHISHTADGTIHFTSNAIWTEFTNTSQAITNNTSSCADIRTDYDDHEADTTIHYVNPGFFDASSDVDHNATTNTHNLTTDIDHNSLTNTHNLTTDIDHNQLTNYSVNYHFTSDAIWSSMANNTANIITNTSNLATHTVDGTIHFTSNAIWTEFTNTSGAITANTSNLVGTSSAITTHVADTSDPHGANTTQTGIASFATVRITSDQTASGVAYAPNVLFNTTSGGLTASNYTKGTLLVVYS